MKELTLRLDYWVNEELVEYLLQLKGIKKVVIDNNGEDISIIYDSNIIGIYIIKKEIELFLNIEKIPSLVGFDKHFKEKTIKCEINIKDLCCEYCLKSNIEELLMLDGIESVVSDFDYKDKENVKIKVTYDNKLISEEDILNLEIKFNN